MTICIHIELIQPISSENRFARFLEEQGEGLFHLYFLIEDFDNEVSALKEKGFTVEEEVAGIGFERDALYGMVDNASIWD